jgi:5-enolpyruvylshikimate-3-phosphate synthase
MLNKMFWDISAKNPLCGSVAVPGSKSHTIRAVIAAFLPGTM